MQRQPYYYGYKSFGETSFVLYSISPGLLVIVLIISPPRKTRIAFFTASPVKPIDSNPIQSSWIQMFAAFLCDAVACCALPLDDRGEDVVKH
jgi:hypothetical protein